MKESWWIAERTTKECSLVRIQLDQKEEPGQESGAEKGKYYVGKSKQILTIENNNND